MKMKRRRKTFALAAVFAAGVWAAFADPVISDITVKQRWPWNGKVDIDYTLVAETNCDVTLTATYLGSGDPIVFTNGVIAKTQVGVKPGRNHVVWNPKDSGLGGKTLANFTVTAEAASVADRAYLVLNLIDGSYEFASAPPSVEDGGWTNTIYKSTKMVFRRIPAGTYKLGNSSDAVKLVHLSNPGRYSPKCPLRDVTITSDFYIGIFKVTAAQRDAVVNDSTSSTTFTGYRFYYDEMRGTSQSNGIDWPSTGHEVYSASFLGKMRAKMKLDSSCTIDLPTDAMWEAAARGGIADGVTANGGTASDSLETISNLVNRIGWTAISKAFDPSISYPGNGQPVGLLEPNSFGLYDVCGDLSELVMDVSTTTSGDVEAPTGETVDPIGAESIEGGTSYRIAKCCGYGSGMGWNVLPAFRSRVGTTSAAKNSARLCIYLNPLKK